MYKYLLFLFIVSVNSFAFEYGKVRFRLPENNKNHQFSLGITQERSNDLIDSNGLELMYLFTIKGPLKIGASLTKFSTDESRSGEKLKNDLLTNGIIQNLNLRENSLFLNSKYRVANGIMNFFSKFQRQVYMDLGVGIGVTNIKNSKDSSSSSELGWSYGLELGADINTNYFISLNLSKTQDDLSNNTDLGLRIGYSW